MATGLGMGCVVLVAWFLLIGVRQVGRERAPRGAPDIRANGGRRVMERAEQAFGSDVVRRVGMWSAAATAVLAAVSFGVAATTPPRTGPFAAPGTAIAYPYSNAAQFVPRDFLWMVPALLMMLAFVVLAICIRERRAAGQRVFGTIGSSLATVSFGVIAIDYFIQLRTVQPALARGEVDGLVILSQYNPHGVFIALEELGFLLAGVSFLFLALALGSSRLERATRWVLLVASALVVASFVGMSVLFGLSIEYRFEVTVIAILWLTLAVVGVLLAFAFSRQAPERTLGEGHA
jgi:hypothetical protein